MAKQKPIQSNSTVITVSGKVFYNDRRRRIDVKKPIRDLFEQGQNEVGYIMELCLNEEKLLARVKELGEQKVVPVILYFTREAEI